MGKGSVGLQVRTSAAGGLWGSYGPLAPSHGSVTGGDHHGFCFETGNKLHVLRPPICFANSSSQ